MASVDDRIVRMEFDNAAFERKVSTTLTSLGQLDKALQFSGAKEGLSGIQGFADKFNLGNMGTHIESVSSKFLALSTIAITALSNITSKAMQAGTQIVKSLALDGIMGGFREYELKLGSIQTIMAGTGASLDEVNKKLQELNTYSDKTIYSFKDMTSNIGKFTNAGLDLDTSVKAIQGVAQVAAVSGANADEASRAMYNFAQALSKGSVQLIDWKSIEMANMATKEFKQQLIDSAVATGDLTKKGDEYITSTGKSVTATKGFNDSLTDAWLTTDVLTTTLGKYSDATTDIGKKAFAAAQDIKTFSQLMDTTKEAIGSGWAQSFEIVAGNFDEAKKLWGGLGKAIGAFVQDSANSRNKLLQDWKDLGGRGLLIASLQAAFQNLGKVLDPIKEAFRDIFPPMTGQRLMDLTKAFADFAASLRPSEKTIENLHRIFKGLFGILEIGWEVIKQTAKFFGTLFDAISGASSGSFLALLARIGDFFTGLNKMLVEGEGIKHFFEVLGGVIAIPIALIGDLKDKMLNFFGVVSDSGIMDKTGESFGRLKDRFQSLSEVFDKITGLWEPVKNALMKIKDVFDEVVAALNNWFGEFISKLAAVFKSGDFNKILDALNVGLFGGLLLVMNKFINKGVKINATLQGFFGGGLFEKIGKSFDQLTGVLQSMQTKIKAEALMKIAEAIAILTASVLVLSLIDSAALTKSLTAMAVGFGQLMAAFAVLNKISMGPTSAATFTIVSTGMILLSGAILILTAAVKVLSTLDWKELATGLGGLAALLTILVIAVEPLAKQSLKMVAAGVGLIAMGVALTILAGAVKLFSLMNVGDMAKGFVAIAVGLLILAGAMELMPMSVLLIGPGLIAVAFAMNLLAGALKIFATMSWGEIAKGLVTLAGALGIIAGVMQGMPLSLPITAAGLILVGIALNEIAAAMKIMATMSWGEIAKGLVAMAGALLVLGVATTAMSGAIPGAIAVGIVSGALVILAGVLQAFAVISWDDLLHGLAGIAAIFAVLGIAALALEPVIPALLGLGAALILIGGGFALFGLGVSLVAEGLALFIDLGPKAGQALEDMLKAMGRSLPAIFTGLAQGIIEFAKTIADAAPILVDALVVILNKLLDGLETLIPKVLKLLGMLISGIIEYLGTVGVPQLIEAGLHIILALLQGIRDHIDDVIIIVGEIITNFVDALAVELPKIVDSVANLFIQLLTSVAEAVGRVSSTLMFGIGISFIDGFMQGITESATSGPVQWFMNLAENVIKWIGDTTRTLWNTGVGFIGGLLGGINEKIGGVTSFFTGLGANIIKWIGDALGMLRNIGANVITGFWNGIKDSWNAVGSWFDSLANLIKYHIPNPLGILYDVGKQIVTGLLHGLQDMWHTVTDWVGNAVNGLKKVITSALDILSPSKFMIWVGEMVIAGLVQPFKEDTSMETHVGNFVDKTSKLFENSISSITSNLGDITEFQPTITPVLDLTEVKSGAQKISDYISASPIPVSASYDQAKAIVTTPSNVITPPTDESATVAAGVKFEQNIYAPTQLSTSDIYKQTRNQITMAKEALSIP
jgi:tape measure domain-containing protein